MSVEHLLNANIKVSTLNHLDFRKCIAAPKSGDFSDKIVLRRIYEGKHLVHTLLHLLLMKAYKLYVTNFNIVFGQQVSFHLKMCPLKDSIKYKKKISTLFSPMNVSPP